MPGVNPDVPALGWIVDRRARLMHAAIVAGRPAKVEDIRRLPAVSLWTDAVVQETIAVLAGEGSIEEDAWGRIIIHPRPAYRQKAA